MPDREWSLQNEPHSLENRSVRRIEDNRLLTGNGRYAADQIPSNSLHAQFLRSPHAHAWILNLDTGSACNAPGVVAVYTAEDLERCGVGALPCGWKISDRAGRPMTAPPHYPLAKDRVRHVGDPVAMVVAETKRQAEDAVEMIAAEFEPLDAVTDTAEAAASGAVQIWPEAPGNLCCDWEIGDDSAVEAAFAAAVEIVPIALRNNRLVAAPMEPRSIVASYDKGSNRYKLITCSQNPHSVRAALTTHILRVPENRLRVICGDVGGGFGARINVYPEDAVLVWAAGQLGRTISWTASRLETFQTDTQGRDHQTEAWLAVDGDGKFLALRVRTLANMGAYLGQSGTAIASYYYAQLLSGVYRIPAIHCEVRLVFTNTVPIDAYRGAGRPEATYVLERLIDAAAARNGIDPIALRQRNFIPKDAFPYETPLGLTYDCGDHERTLRAALEGCDYPTLQDRKDAASQRGLLYGFGVSTYVEIAGAYPARITREYGSASGRSESAHVRVHPGGTVTVFTPMQANGQGHETTFAQLVAERLCVSIEEVEVVEGDTDRTPLGRGSAASRSLVVGGAALARALDRIVDKAKGIAAHLLASEVSSIRFRDGYFISEGRGDRIAFREVAKAAYDGVGFPLEEIEPGLEAIAFFEPENWTYPAGCHACEVEVDPDTGRVRIVKLVAADDVGNVVNPMIVHGQIHGGLAQGIGQALFEDCIYEPESGQLLTASFMDYALPRASDLPSFEVALCPTPTTLNPFGAKGCAEVGTVGIPPAIVNAVIDALRPLGVDSIEMPLTPERVWRAIQDAPRDRAADKREP